MRTGSSWSISDIRYAHRMRSKMSIEQIAAALNRTPNAVKVFLNKKRLEATGYVVRPTEIPPTALEDRDHRAALPPRDLTAEFCGDPLPGYSALERR